MQTEQRTIFVDGKPHTVTVLPYIPPEEHDITWEFAQKKSHAHADPFASMFDYIQSRLDHQS